MEKQENGPMEKPRSPLRETAQYSEYKFPTNTVAENATLTPLLR